MGFWRQAGRAAGLALLALGVGGVASEAQTVLPFRVSGAEMEQHNPDVASDAEGNFVVLWGEPGNGESSDLRGRRFDRDGEALDEDDLDLPPVGNLEDLAVAVSREGGFAVVWEFGPQPERGLGLRARRFDGKGVRLPGQDVPVAGQGAGSFDLAALPDGDFVVVWLEKEKLTGPPDLLGDSAADCPRPALVGLRFDDDSGGGTQEKERFDIACGVSEDAAPSIAVAGASEGDPTLIVTWQEEGPAGDILVRFVDLGEKPASQHVARVNQLRAGRRSRPAVAARGPQDLAVAWESHPGIDLVVCLDSSGSITPALFKTQVEGLAVALEDPIAVPRDGSLRLAAIQTGLGQSPVFGLTSVDSQATAESLAATLRSTVRSPSAFDPAVCINAAVEMLEVEPHAALRMILLATDGLPRAPNNADDARFLTSKGRKAAERAARRGIHTIDVIELQTPEPEPQAFLDLEEIVIPQPAGGERGRVRVAEGAAEVAEALAASLAAENPAGSGLFTRAVVAGEVGPEIQVNSRVKGDQSSPALAFDPEGSWLATWEDRQRGRIAAQVFDPDGLLAGGEIDVDTWEVEAEAITSRRPRVAPLGGGRFVVVWEQQPEGEDTETRIWARLLEPDLTAPCVEGETEGCLRPKRVPRGTEWRAPVTSVER